jgi:hypothetical protein
MHLRRLFTLFTAVVGGNALTCPSGQSAKYYSFLFPVPIDGNIVDIGLGCVNCRSVAKLRTILVMIKSAEPGSSCAHQAVCRDDDIVSSMPIS